MSAYFSIHALILSVEEKPSIQAIERPGGFVESDNGDVVRALNGSYKRHGTLNPFAAPEVGTGQVHAKSTVFSSKSRAKRQFRQQGPTA